MNAQPITHASQHSAVLFDLANTLFDHQHSIKCALQAVYPGNELDIQELVATYDHSLQQAYDAYLKGEITYEEKDTLKIQLFIRKRGVSHPSTEDIKDFRHKYVPAYRANRRACPGSIETLIRLKELGYKLGIVMNGQKEDQRQKAEQIGVLAHVAVLCTSEEIGAMKPDPKAFRYALEALGADVERSYMVGDDVEADIKGALNVGLTPILFDPKAVDVKKQVAGKQVPVIRDMREVLDVMGAYAQ